MSNSSDNRPIIELLCDAIARDTIRGWSVNGPNVIFHRDHVRFRVPAASAESVLRKLLADQEESARTGDGAVFAMQEDPVFIAPATSDAERLEPPKSASEDLGEIPMGACAWL